MNRYTPLDRDATERAALERIAELPGLLVDVINRITATVNQLNHSLDALEKLIQAAEERFVHPQLIIAQDPANMREMRREDVEKFYEDMKNAFADRVQVINIGDIAPPEEPPAKG